MPKYFFTAKSLKGEPKTGSRETKDERELARVLHQEGYILISAIPAEETQTPKFSVGVLPFLSRVSLKDKMIFTRNLRVMISAGVSLPRALKTLAEQTKSRKLKKALLKIAELVIKGKNFSDSLAQHSDVFPELFWNMVKVGEESGTLEESLAILTRQMERESDLKSKIKGALIYPAVIILAMIGIGMMMLIVVVPKLAQTFEELNIELPLTTRIVIGLGAFLTEKWYFAILLLFLLIFFLRTLFKTGGGKRIWDILVLKIPIISPLVKKTNAAYTVRTLGSLIAAGVSMVRSLEIVSGTLGNFYFRRIMAEAVEKVKKGEKLSQILKPHQNLYPLTVIQMLEVGEETGQTSEILQKLADFFEDEVTVATKNLAAVIEPVLMLIIGGTVGFFAISMVQPLYSMLSGIK